MRLHVFDGRRARRERPDARIVVTGCAAQIAPARWSALPGVARVVPNPDKLRPGERCASTSNRNFEGRQGKGGRTHLVSPLVAAATAVRGTLSSPADLESDAPASLETV